MAPAIRLAEEGFVLTQGDADILDGVRQGLCRPAQCRSVFLKRRQALGCR